MLQLALDSGNCLNYFCRSLQWATKVLRHFAILEYLRPISPLNPTILPPPPQTMLHFMSLELAFFLNNIEKGEGVSVSMLTGFQKE